MTKASLTRRDALLGLATAATAAATTSTAGASSVAENPILIELGDELSDFAKDHFDAKEAKEWIIAEWGPQWPVPDPKVFSGGEGTKEYKGLTGEGMKIPAKNVLSSLWCRIGTPESFEAAALREDKEAMRCAGFKSPRKMEKAKKFAAKHRAAIPHARAYWAEAERIEKASGIKEADVRETYTREVLAERIAEIMETPETTMTGVLIKAEALAEWGKVERFFRVLEPKAATWAADLATATLRQSGGTS